MKTLNIETLIKYTIVSFILIVSVLLVIESTKINNFVL